MLLNVEFNLSNITDEGVIIAITGYVIVFSALLLLFFVFNNLPKLIYLNLRNRQRKLGKRDEEIKEEVNLNISGEVNAAISTALYLYFTEMHDEESNIVTIKKVSRAYSPWSSKIYTVHNLYQRN